MSRPLLLGHRGARGYRAIPENTLASFDRALGDGCDGFEFDVRLTRDGAAVVCHDPQFGGIEIACAEAQQLRELPLLADVLARYKDTAFLDIELKVAGAEAATMDLLRRHKPGRGYVVSSFLPEVLQTIREGEPSILLGLICETTKQLEWWTELPIDYLIPHYSLATSQLVATVKNEGKKIVVWTVNSTADMKRFAGLGVDGIISDHTDVLCKAVAG